MAANSPWATLPRPALIPVRLHCRRCLTAELYCPRCGAGLLVQGPASHVATNHLLRRDCIACNAAFGLTLDGYQTDASAQGECPLAKQEVAVQPTPLPPVVAPSGAGPMASRERVQLALPVDSLTPNEAPITVPQDSVSAPERPSNRRAMPLRSWWQLGHPTAARDGATVASAYRFLYGNSPQKMHGCNVFIAPELDAIEEYLRSEQWIAE